MVLCLGEPPVRFLCCCCSFLIFILLLYLHLSMFFILLLFFIHIFFPTSSLTLPWTIAGFLHPFYTFSPAHRRVIRGTFIFQPTFSTFLAHPNIFGTTCFYQSFTGSWQLLFWKLQGFILILETQTRPICLFDSQ